MARHWLIGSAWLVWFGYSGLLVRLVWFAGSVRLVGVFVGCFLGWVGGWVNGRYLFLRLVCLVVWSVNRSIGLLIVSP